MASGAFAVTGTPTDAVNLALRKLFADAAARPDPFGRQPRREPGRRHHLFGHHLRRDGRRAGRDSARSRCSQVYSREWRRHGFAAAGDWGAKVLAPLLDAPLAERTLVNVNFPALAADKVKGIRVVRQGFHDYARGTRGRRHAIRAARPTTGSGSTTIEHTLDHGTDLEAIDDGYIAVTPLQLDLTHHSSLGELAERFAT